NALFLYVWLEMPKEKQTIETVLDLMSLAKVDEETGSLSDLGDKFNSLPDNHPAKDIYIRMVQAAGDTIRSVLFTANARMAVFNEDKVKRVLSKDELDFASLGAGKNGDKKTKTMVFCLIPDNDNTYNFLAGMFYTQAFQELYYMADF